MSHGQKKKWKRRRVAMERAKAMVPVGGYGMPTWVTVFQNINAGKNP